jgi:DNA-binding transcriptional regulator YhcF (GntR family)
MTPIPEAVARYLEKHRPEEGDDGFIFKGCRDDAVKGMSAEEEARRDVNRVSRLNVRLNRLKKSVRKHFPWPSNALRASVLSYRSQVLGSTEKTAEEMGNSKTILKRAYQELTTEADAKEWFATDPHHVSHFTAQQILRYMEEKAVEMKLARKLKKAKEDDEEEGYPPEDQTIPEEEMREAVADSPSTEATEKATPKAKPTPKRKGKK